METENAYAKINLTLDVIRKREDGYHDLDMVMQSVSLCDKVSLIEQGERLKVMSNLSYLPTGEKNLAAKATRLFYGKIGKELTGMQIEIEKNIPVCAGLAGGSSDGAAVLRILNRIHGNPLSDLELRKVALSVGADVPYCLVGGTKRAEGVGEILTELPALPPCYIVLCKPNFSISTPELFQKLQSSKIKHRPNTLGVIESLQRGDLQGVACRMFNVFEDTLVLRQGKTIVEIKSVMIDCGALGSSMSGSGPTVIGLFHREEQAQHAVQKLNSEHPETFLTVPV